MMIYMCGQSDLQMGRMCLSHIDSHNHVFMGHHTSQDLMGIHPRIMFFRLSV